MREEWSHEVVQRVFLALTQMPDAGTKQTRFSAALFAEWAASIKEGRQTNLLDAGQIHDLALPAVPVTFEDAKGAVKRMALAKPINSAIARLRASGDPVPQGSFEVVQSLPLPGRARRTRYGIKFNPLRAPEKASGHGAGGEVPLADGGNGSACGQISLAVLVWFALILARRDGDSFRGIGVWAGITALAVFGLSPTILVAQWIVWFNLDLQGLPSQFLSWLPIQLIAFKFLQPLLELDSGRPVRIAPWYFRHHDSGGSIQMVRGADAFSTEIRFSSGH